MTARRQVATRSSSATGCSERRGTWIAHWTGSVSIGWAHALLLRNWPTASWSSVARSLALSVMLHSAAKFVRLHRIQLYASSDTTDPSD